MHPVIGPEQEQTKPMNIIERGWEFVERLQELVGRSEWKWRHCPRCGSTHTNLHGSYLRRPWCFDGRKEVRVRRHYCHECKRTYSETIANLTTRSWYAREVHRCAIDHWQHLGTSFRRTAEVLRSWLGRQERYELWQPLFKRGTGEHCYLSASTVHRWLDRAGKEAERSVKGQLKGIVSSEVVGTDGLWVRLRGGTKRVALMLVDSVTGVIWPPVVALGEESEKAWQSLFERGKQAGLELEMLRAVTSDGARGLLSYLNHELTWVQQQRCVWHMWRNLGKGIREAAAQAASGPKGAAAEPEQKRVRRELSGLIREVLDAVSFADAEQALSALGLHPLGAKLAQHLDREFDQLLAHLVDYYKDLQRVAPEWCWRDFRQRLSRGRNHGSDARLERAMLVWAIYHNFTPAQWRSERKRHYRHPGLSPLEVAGVPPGKISYLDALGV